MTDNRTIEELDNEIAGLKEDVELLESGTWKIEIQPPGEPMTDVSTVKAERYKRIIKRLQSYKERLLAE